MLALHLGAGVSYASFANAIAAERVKVMCSTYLPLFWWLRQFGTRGDTVDGWNPAPVEVGSLSHYLQVFYTPSQVVIARFQPSTVWGNSIQIPSCPIWQVHLECEGAKAADPPKWRVKFAEAEDEADNAGVLWMTSLGEDGRFVLWCAL